MTKDELIEAMKDFSGDMKVQVKAFQVSDYDTCELYDCDIKSIHKCYHYKKDFILINLEEYY